MLKSETNTQEVMNEVLEQAQEYFKDYSIYNNFISVIWDHGHWWIQFDDNNEEKLITFDVVDIEDTHGDNKFGFEEV